MGEFFKSRNFKILTGILAALIATMFVTAYLGGTASPVSQVAGFITAPFQKLSSGISGMAVAFFQRFLSSEQLYEENQALQEEVRNLREKLVDLDSYKKDNEHYRQYLDLKERNPTFVFEPAQVIGREPNDRFYGFMVDKGSLDGVAVYDPVITPDGLVGWVSEVGLSYAKVSTILDVSMDVGAVDSRTRDIGVVTGEVTLAKDGLCKLSYLPRENTVQTGDLVITSGLGGVFPKGLIIGTVLDLQTEKSGISMFATVQPASEIKTLSEVFLLTSFSGQGDDLAVEPPAAPERPTPSPESTADGEATSSAPESSPAPQGDTSSQDAASSQGDTASQDAASSQAADTVDAAAQPPLATPTPTPTQTPRPTLPPSSSAAPTPNPNPPATVPAPSRFDEEETQ